jgi:hypothetical protein
MAEERHDLSCCEAHYHTDQCHATSCWCWRDCRCACCKEAKARLLGDRDVAMACNCLDYEIEERCDCWYCRDEMRKIS